MSDPLGRTKIKKYRGPPKILREMVDSAKLQNENFSKNCDYVFGCPTNFQAERPLDSNDPHWYKNDRSPNEIVYNVGDRQALSNSTNDFLKFENDFINQQSDISQESKSENEKSCVSKVSNSGICNELNTVYDASNNLSTDFLSILRRNSFTDVSIKCGDYIQQVHKVVLSARSPVFEAMFSTNMEENEKGVVTISDIDETVLDDMLTFIYGAQVRDLTLPKAYDLLHVAEKYQVKGLKDICTNFLRSCLSIQTAVQILQYADLYDEKLKEDTLNYVCKNFSALKTTEEWRSLQSEKPRLSLDVYSMVVEKYEEQGAWRNSNITK